MPTPRATIVATVGAEVLTSMAAASSRMPAEPTPSPSRATRIGSPAATTEPKVSTSSSSATTTPMTSPAPPGARPALSGTSPPKATCRPASTVGSAASCSGVRSPKIAGSVTGTSYRTSISTVPPSSETRGGNTSSTCGRAASRSVSSVTSSPGTAPPSGSWTTTRSTAPEAAGNSSRSRSVPACEAVPGTFQSSCGVPPATPARPVARATTTSQVARVRQGCAAAAPPSRYSMRVIASLLRRRPRWRPVDGRVARSTGRRLEAAWGRLDVGWTSARFPAEVVGDGCGRAGRGRGTGGTGSGRLSPAAGRGAAGGRPRRGRR